MKQTEEQKHMTFGEKIDLIVALSQIAGKPAEAFLRRPGTVGVRYFGNQAAIGLIAMPIWIANWNALHAIVAFYATLFMFIVHRISRRWTPLETHSQFTGRPWIPGDIMKAKGTHEISVLFLGGTFVCIVSPGLGTWMLVSAVGLAVSYSHDKMRDEAIDRCLNDAMIEQGLLQERRAQRMVSQRSSADAAEPYLASAWSGSAGSGPVGRNPARRAGRTAVVLLVLIAGCAAGWVIGTGKVPIPERMRGYLTGEDPELRKEYREMVKGITPAHRQFAPTFEEYAKQKREWEGSDL
jgi:hypothetical protein